MSNPKFVFCRLGNQVTIENTGAWQNKIENSEEHDDWKIVEAFEKHWSLLLLLSFDFGILPNLFFEDANYS